jgi:hypothetical protein
MNHGLKSFDGDDDVNGMCGVNWWIFSIIFVFFYEIDKLKILHKIIPFNKIN